MKANKSPDGVEVTPSKKKLKQGRLPFMLISDVSPKAAAPEGRKRKLSVPDVEPVTKVGKISKENDLTDDLVVISDDDSKDASKPQKDDKPQNPYVKLVDTAWKKKLQKGKTPKKSKQATKKLSKGKNRCSKENTAENVHDKESADVEMMEVEVQVHKELTKNDSNDQSLPNGNKEALQNNESDLKTDLSSDNKDLQSKESETSYIRKTRPVKSSIKYKSSLRAKNSLEKSVNSESFQDAKPSPQKSVKEPSPAVTSSSVKPTQIETEIISIDDSNKSSDVHKDEPNIKESFQEPEQSSDTEHGKTIENEQKINDNTMTPKRSTRNKTKKLEETNTSIISTVSSKLDESMSSTPGTPKQNKSSVNLDESMNDSTANLSNISVSNLTPKQVSQSTLFSICPWNVCLE